MPKRKFQKFIGKIGFLPRPLRMKLRFVYRLTILFPIVYYLRFRYQSKFNQKTSKILFEFRDGSCLKYSTPWEYLKIIPSTGREYYENWCRIYDVEIVRKWDYGVKNLSLVLGLWTSKSKYVVISCDFDLMTEELLDKLKDFSNKHSNQVLLLKSFTKGYHLYFVLEILGNSEQFTGSRAITFLKKTLPTEILKTIDSSYLALSCNYLICDQIECLSQFLKNSEYWSE